MDSIPTAEGAWTITADHLEDGKRTATCGPRETTFWPSEIAAHPAAQPFRIYDDDGELYYEGYCILPHGLTAAAFAPLDDFGTPNAGATAIHYKNPAGTWEML